MNHLFPQYGMVLLVAAIVLLLAGMIETGVPVASAGQVLIARYPLCLRLFCVVLIVFCLFFAFALASVQRELALARLGIWSLLGVPSSALAAEVFSRRVTLGPGSVSCSSFYQHRFSRQQGSVSKVIYDDSSKMFRVYFADGATLRLSAMMRGSQQVAHALTPLA